MSESKNKRIADTMRDTYAKRRTQTAVTITCKVNKSALKPEQKLALKNMFLEAKWIYNYALAHNMIEGYSHKDFKFITKKDKFDNDIPVVINTLKSSLVEKILERMRDSKKSLEKLKEKGYKTGDLKFKKEYNSLLFKQYGVTHYIKGNFVKLQGIKRPIRITGLKQLERLSNPDITTIDLKFDGYDYWVNISCFVDNDYKANKFKNQNKLDKLGVDLGVATTITLSTGEKIDCTVEESERLKKLKKKLKRQEEYSNNWKKTKSLIAKENAKLKRKKIDLTNKIVYKLFDMSNIVITQDDNIADWKKKKTNKNGKKVSTKSTKKIHHSILGRLKAKMKEYDRCAMLNKYFPTTKYCRYCGFRHNNLSLEDRIFECPNCGHTQDRDIHAANNMIFFYDRYKDTVGTTDTSKLHGYEKVIEYKLNGVYGHLSIAQKKVQCL